MKHLPLPRHLLLLSAAVALLTPFVARLPGVAFRGWEWFSVYLPDTPGGLLFFSGLALIPGLALFLAGKASESAPLAYWLALAGLVGFLLWAHGAIDLTASSTASLALLFVPVFALGAVIVGWLIGRLCHSQLGSEGARFWFAGSAMLAAVGFGLAITFTDTAQRVARESKFPSVSVKELPLRSSTVFPCCSVGVIEALSLGEFDLEPGNDLAVLGSSGVAVLDARSYTTMRESALVLEDCDGCTHMYAEIVPDGKGSFRVATGDGLADDRGRLLWRNDVEGFSRVSPVRLSSGKFAFLTYDSSERVELRDENGSVLWTRYLTVADIGVYGSPAGEQMPIVIVRSGEKHDAYVLTSTGDAHRTAPVPDWAMEVQGIDWPDRGHFLMGAQGVISVRDPSGKEVFAHVIERTSFDPYHGPYGVAVRFRTDGPSYLAVVSSGSSGMPRSVLVVFDPKGRLVWQEEREKIRAMVVAPGADGKSEVLLVGGREGLIEYSLPPQ